MRLVTPDARTPARRLPRQCATVGEELTSPASTEDEPVEWAQSVRLTRGSTTMPRHAEVLGLVLLLCGCRGESEPAEPSAEPTPKTAAEPAPGTTTEPAQEIASPAREEPACARPGGFVASLELEEAPPGFVAGQDIVDEKLALDPRIELRIAGEPTFDAGLLRVGAVLANPTDEAVELDVITGGVPGLSSLPFTLRLDPPPRPRPGLGPQSFRGPEVYPGATRWRLPPASELRMFSSVCVARYELPAGSSLRIHYALETASGPKPQGTLEVVVPTPSAAQ
jgi:hypothetical protein